MVLKLSVSGICLILLLLLFVFGEQTFQEDAQIISEEQETDSVRDSFIFNPPELVYDGNGELDLLEGVSLEQYSLEELKKNTYARIYAGENLSNKTIEYTVDTEEGRIRSKRALHLINYEGPTIALPDELPTVTMSTVEQMAELIKSEGDYKADDGFGNDARDYVQIDAEKSYVNSAEIQYTFILENAFGDRTVAKADALISDVPATIVLTASEVNIRVGDIFYPEVYIAEAIDSNGQSIVDEVMYNNDVVIEEPGEYVVEYELRGQKISIKVTVSE